MWPRLAVFEGVALTQVDNTTCFDNDAKVAYAKNRKGTGFQRPYEIVDDAGAAAPTTWVEGRIHVREEPEQQCSGEQQDREDQHGESDCVPRGEVEGPDSQTHALVEFAN